MTISLLIIPCGVLTARVLLEVALSIYGIRDSLALPETQRLLRKERFEPGSKKENVSLESDQILSVPQSEEDESGDSSNF